MTIKLLAFCVWRQAGNINRTQSSEIRAMPIKIMQQIFPKWIDEPQKTYSVCSTAMDPENLVGDRRSDTPGLPAHRLAQLSRVAAPRLHPPPGAAASSERLKKRSETQPCHLTGIVFGTVHLQNSPEGWLRCPLRLHCTPTSPWPNFASFPPAGAGSQSAP